MEKCQKIDIPSYCDDVRIQRNLNLGFFACDPSFPYRNFAASVFNESKIEEDGALWVYDLNKRGSAPEKLTIKGFKGPFHPSGITFAPTSDDGTPARIVILAVNHVPSETPRVEVLYYYPARKSLVYKKTIHSNLFQAANKIAASGIVSHLNDDTPSFFVTNDHGYNITNWKREYEEKYNLPAASVVYYHPRADRVQEVGWRFQMPGAIVSADAPDSYWLALGKGATLERYHSHLVSAEHQEQKIQAVDTNEQITVSWPGMMMAEAIHTKKVNTGMDYDRATKGFYTVSHPRWNDYVQHAKDKMEDKDAKPSVKAGLVISKGVEYTIRLGEHRPQPLKDVEFDENEFPRRYRKKLFLEDVVSHDGSDFGSPSAVAVNGDHVLVSSHYEQSFLDCNFTA
ncbi:Serum paraoxonase/lactonase 3 [Linnemannia zychae]|nr:Serum paraoxonase/lactonase 3 [Linnemannia zychae]